jgi:hypothetical protein
MNMNYKRTDSRYVPPAPNEPTPPNPSTVDNTEEAKKSPAFREALKADDAREAQAQFEPDKDLWGRSGAGADVAKESPHSAQKHQEENAKRENGYGD